MLISAWSVRISAKSTKVSAQDVLGVAEVHEAEVQAVEAEQRVRNCAQA